MTRTVVSVDRVTTDTDDSSIIEDEEVVQQNLEDLLVTWFGYESDDEEEGIFFVDDVDQFKTRVDAVAEMVDGNIEFTVTVAEPDA